MFPPEHVQFLHDGGSTDLEEPGMLRGIHALASPPVLAPTFFAPAGLITIFFIVRAKVVSI